MTTAVTTNLQDLREVIDAYNGLAERLQGSQQILQREVARLRDELAEKNRQIARKNRLAVLGEVAAGVAHEIRNPLGGIELYAGLIAREAAGNEKIAGWAHKIQKATRGLSGIVGDILDFTRPLKPQMKTVVLEEVICAALDLASSAMDQAHVAVERDGRNRLAIRGDFNLLQRAFLNVILNAVEAMPAGGTLMASICHARLDGRDALSASFADTGGGIAPADLPKVFDPFFTKKAGGTGLGLAMTARIVSAHQGKLTAHNGPQGGAVFVFLLPVDGPQDEEHA